MQMCDNPESKYKHSPAMKDDRDKTNTYKYELLQLSKLVPIPKSRWTSQCCEPNAWAWAHDMWQSLAFHKPLLVLTMSNKNVHDGLAWTCYSRIGFPSTWTKREQKSAQTLQVVVLESVLHCRCWRCRQDSIYYLPHEIALLYTLVVGPTHYCYTHLCQTPWLVSSVLDTWHQFTNTP